MLLYQSKRKNNQNYNFCFYIHSAVTLNRIYDVKTQSKNLLHYKIKISDDNVALMVINMIRP